VGKSLETVVKDLNRTLNGWGNHFRYGNSARKFVIIDSYVHQRLAILASRKHGLQGRNWASRYNGAWFRRLGVHRLSGGALRICACMTVNGVGEPCGGEPHARFEGGAEDDAPAARQRVLCSTRLLTFPPYLSCSLPRPRPSAGLES